MTIQTLMFLECQTKVTILITFLILIILLSLAPRLGDIKLIMNVLEDYEATFGQKVNKEKSVFYMHENAPADESNTMHLITTFQR